MNESANISSQVQHTLQQAISHHHAGRLSEAEQLYLMILQEHPMHADANHNLGAMAMQVGQANAALHHLELALLADKSKLQYALSYARALLETGQNKTAAEFVHGSMLRDAPLVAAQSLRQQIRALTHSATAQTETVTVGETMSALMVAARASSTHKKRKTHKVATQNGVAENIFKDLKIRRVAEFKHNQAYPQLESLLRALIAQDAYSEYAWTELAHVLLLQGKPSLPVCQQAAKLFPENAKAISYLAQSLANAGMTQEAITQFQRSLLSDPDNAESHFHFANLLSAQQRFEEAEHHYRRTLAIQENHAKAHCNLGKCLQLSHRAVEAKTHYHLALEIDPQLSSAHHNLGLILKAEGNFEPALACLRKAIKSQFDMFRQQSHTVALASQVQRNKKPIDRTQAYLVLELLQQQFQLLNLEFCLFAGSALGIFREGDLLAFDKDLDIAVHASVDRNKLIQAVQSSGHFQLFTQYGTQEEREHQYSMTLRHLSSNISVDIFFLHPDGDAHFLAGAYHPGQSILCRLERFDFAPHNWRGTLWNLPSNTAHYLEQVYGDKWRQPDRGFDTVLSNPSRIAAAMPPVLCYAYSRLCLFLQERDWVNSHSICQQILARGPDELLLELQAWIKLQTVGP